MVEVLQAARKWGVPPLTMLVGRPNRWRHEDSVFARALEIYESTRVNEYGFPKRRAEDRLESRNFRVEARTVDYAVKAMDDWQAKQEKAKKQLPAGVRPRLVYDPKRRPR